MTTVPDNKNSCKYQIMEALRYLAARCDGALAQDGQGFSKPDSWIGKKLAEADFLNEDQTQQAHQLLIKYKGQLSEGGLTLPDLALSIQEAHEDDQQRGSIRLADDFLIIEFPYHPRHVGAVKNIKGARFVNQDGRKYWRVPMSSCQAVIPNFPHFQVSAEAEAAIKAWQPSPYVGTTKLVGDIIRVKFEYDEELVKRVKTIPGARFDGALVQWIVPLSSQAIAVLQDFEIDPAISPRIAELEAIAKEQAEKESAIATHLKKFVGGTLPSGRQPYAHQVTGVNFLLEHRRAILADDMGLGKSMTALMAAQCFELPIHVVCPASLRLNWGREAQMVGVEISTYSWAKMPKSIDTDFVLIADEAHYMQSYKSARTKTLLTLAASDHCMGLFLLTGTPLKNGRPDHFFPLLKATRHILAKDKSAYERYYCNAHPTRFTAWDTTGAAHLDELHRKTLDVMLRRTKKECLDLPEKTRVVRQVEVSEKAEAHYNEVFDRLRQEYKERIETGQITTAGDALVMLNHLRHAASLAKTETTLELAEEVIEEGGQVVIFVAFKESGDAIATRLGVPFFQGELNTAARQAIVDDFQAGKIKAFVGTLQAGGVGITLTAAQTVILVDRPLTPGDAIQSEDRLHRIGQKNAVTSVWLQMSDVDLMIDKLLQEKQERINLVLQGKRKTLNGVNESVIEVAAELVQLTLGES